MKDSVSSPCYRCKYAQIIELSEAVFFCKHKQEYEDAAEVKLVVVNRGFYVLQDANRYERILQIINKAKGINNGK